MSKTLEANSVFLNPTQTATPSHSNNIIKSCYYSLNELEHIKGKLGTDQFNYVQEYLNRIIMIMQDSQTKMTKPHFNVFAKNYKRDNLTKLPPMAYSGSSLNDQLHTAEYNNQTLSVPEEYKILTSLDKQIAFNKFGERIVTPYVNTDINNPIDAAINASQYIAGNGLGINRHPTPMALNKYT